MKFGETDVSGPALRDNQKSERGKAHFILDATAKSLQPCPTLCDSIDSSPPGSPILGILQARTLDWVAISFSVHSESEKSK